MSYLTNPCKVINDNHESKRVYAPRFAFFREAVFLHIQGQWKETSLIIESENELVHIGFCSIYRSSKIFYTNDGRFKIYPTTHSFKVTTNSIIRL